MWPFKSNIPEINTMTEDEDGNIEIKHSHGQFKMNRKDIVDVQLTKNFPSYLKRGSGDFFDLYFNIFLGIPMAFGIWNFLIYQKNISDPTFFPRHFQGDLVTYEKFLFSPFDKPLIDLILSLIFFVIICLLIGYLTSIIIRYLDFISSKNNILKIKTVGNIFEYEFANDHIITNSFNGLREKNKSKKQSQKLSYLIGILFFSIPFILFIFNWDDPFWFYQKIFETNPKIDFPLTMTNYIDYFRGEPKGCFELFADGLASFGGTILFLIALLIGIIFFCLTFLVFFGLPLIQFVTIPYLIFYFVFSLVDKNLRINWKKEFEFIKWGFADIILRIIIVFIGPIFFFARTMFASFPEKPRNLKNISFWIFCLFSAIIVGFGANFLMRDIIYSPLENLFLQVKDFCEPNKLGYSLFQLEKTIYISFILIISFLTFYLLIPKKRWESFKMRMENKIDDDVINES
jgi:hypothetical protein